MINPKFQMFLVRGIRVIIPPIGKIKICSCNKNKSDRIYNYLKDEGFIESNQNLILK